MENLILYPLCSKYPINEQELFQIDFTIIGLTNETPKYGRKGIKQFSDYTHNGELAVRKIFTYIENGLEISFLYYNNLGEPEFTKTEFKPLDKVEIGKILKSNRERTITYLQVSAIGTPIENGVNALLKKYKTEVDLFIYNNTPDFKNAIANENQEPYLGLLNLNISGSEIEIFTVRDSILNQIS